MTGALEGLAKAGVRVHFHTDNAAFSGSEEAWCLLFDRLSDAGGIVSASWRSSTSFDQAVAERLGPRPGLAPMVLAPDVPLPLGARHWSRLTKALASTFERHRPDVIHINNGGWPGALSCLAAAAVAPESSATLMVVNNIAYPYQRSRLLARRFERRIAQGVHGFVTASTHAGRSLERALNLPPQSTIQIPNAARPVTTPHDASDARQSDSIRSEMLLPDGAVVVLCAARLEARKGHHVLLDAWSRLGTHGPERVLLLAGSGPLLDRVSRQAEECRRQGHDVRVLGHVADIQALYTASDVIVLPSTGHEDMPLVILEAMRAARPVVATTVGGTAELVTDGTTGWLVRPDDTKGLAEVLANVLLDPAERVRRGAAGLTAYRTRFDTAAMVDAYARVWAALYKARRAAR